MVEYLRKNEKYFSLSSIEQECNIPKGVLRFAVRGERELPEKYVSVLDEFMGKLLVVGDCQSKPKEPINDVVTVKGNVVERKPVRKAKNGVKKDVVKDVQKPISEISGKSLLPDMNPDGSFNKSKWGLYHGKAMHVDTGMDLDYKNVGGVWFPV